MVKQERAARTRGALLQTAASLFDRQGYAATSLSQITKETGGISAGALNFHFASKAELAHAVVDAGNATTLAALDEAPPDQGTPLDQLVDLTLTLVRLLEADDTVRAAVRLEQELPDVAPWSRLWRPQVDELLQQSYDEGQLRLSATPESVRDLVTHLVAGAEALLRCREVGPDTRSDRQAATQVEAQTDAVALLEGIWQLVLVGVAALPQDRSLPSPTA